MSTVFPRQPRSCQPRFRVSAVSEMYTVLPTAVFSRNVTPTVDKGLLYLIMITIPGGKELPIPLYMQFSCYETSSKMLQGKFTILPFYVMKKYFSDRDDTVQTLSKNLKV